VLNLREYAAHRNVLADNSLINYNNAFVAPEYLGEGTDWQSELFNTAMMTNHNVSFAGGTEKSTYNMSAGYSNQDGIAAGSGFQRYALSGNFDSNIKKWVKVGINFAMSNTFQKLTVSDQSLVSVALRSTPDIPVRNADGTFAAADEQFMPTNPMAMAMLIDNNQENFGLRGNTYGEFYFDSWLKGLTWRTELAFDFGMSNVSRFQPTYRLSQTQFSETNEGMESKNYSKFWGWTNTLTYNRTFAEDHRLQVMAGIEYQKAYWQYLMGLRNGYPTNSLPDISIGDATTAANDGYKGDSPFIGTFARLFYSYTDTYMLTATIRRDGSSNFAKGNRWGTFPSAAFAWRISEYSFLKERIDNFKIRLGWGMVGNQNLSVDHFAYLMRYNVQTTPWGAGLYADNMFNEDVSWEATSSWNAGFDLAFAKSRIEIVFDWYNKTTRNLLMPIYVPVYIQAGRNLAYGNVGSLNNHGFEVTLNTLNVKNRDFNWRSSINFSLNRNKVIDIGENGNAEIYGRVDDNSWGMTGQTIINRTKEGRPIGEFYGYQVIGRFEQATDFYMYNDKGKVVRTPVTTLSDGSLLPIDEKAGVWIGDLIYKDQNGDGIIDEQDRTVIGNPEPKFTFGFNNTFTYKNLDLSVQLIGVFGNDVVNYVRRYMDNPRRNISNLFISALDYATVGLINENGPNDYRNVQVTGGDSHTPRMPLSTVTSEYDYAFSDRFVEDGSYLRIQNISLGYSLPQDAIRKIGVNNVKLYVNLQNVYTFSKYKGYDPEIGVVYGYQNSLVTGADVGRYPTPRIYTFGINVTF
jgi:TonB-linked SusC/RagA family outer membrane protein